MSVQVYLSQNDCFGTPPALLLTTDCLEIKPVEQHYQLGSDGPWHLCPRKYVCTVENYELSDRYILIDLYVKHDRQLKRRRCGFSTRKQGRKKHE